MTTAMHAGRETWLDRTLDGWLALIRRHFVLAHLVVALTLVSVSHVIFAALDLEPNLVQTLVVEVAVSLGSLALPFLVTFAALRHEILTLVHLTEGAPPVATAVVRRFLSEQLRQTAQKVEDLTKGGLPLTPEEVLGWCKLCFSTATGRYLGTDSNVPSAYMELYRRFLQAHADYLRRSPGSDSMRVIIADEATLDADRETDPVSYQEFVDWHSVNDVTLRRLSPTEARRLAEECGTEGILDIGLWEGDFALSWKYENKKKSIVLRLHFVGERRYAHWHEFVQAVSLAGTPFPD